LETVIPTVPTARFVTYANMTQEQLYEWLEGYDEHAEYIVRVTPQP